MSAPDTVIFCDFDGTVAERDVGYNLFHHFSDGRNDALLPDWKAGRLSTRDCLRKEAEMVQASPDAILAFVDQFRIEESFVPFVRTGRRAGLPVVIISEGLDLYIHRLLGAAGLGHLPVLSNIGHLENGTIKIEFPYDNISCDWCGSCKGERIDLWCGEHAPGARVVFIGDGYSDACAAKRADILFAKKDLVTYCSEESIAYHAFEDFHHVAEQLKSMDVLPSRE